MKVLEKQDVSNWSYKHKCSSCESLLQIESNDLTHYHYSGYYNEPSYDTYSTVCSVCRSPITVPTDSIPKLVQLKVQNKPSATDYYNK